MQLVTLKINIMVKAVKDLRISLSNHETEQFKEMVIILSQVETLMAKELDLIPLDVLLDFSGLVSQSFSIYGEAIGPKKSVSWLKLNRLFQRLIDYHIDAKEVLMDKEHLIQNRLSLVCSFIQSVRESLTLADIVNR